MSADLLKRLAEAGTPMDLIMEVAETLAEAKAAERLLEKRRAADRERKAVSNPRIPRNSTEEAELAEGGQEKEKSPNPLKKNTPPVEASASTAPGGRGDRGSKIEESWQPPAIADLPPEAKALAELWPAKSYRAEAEAFRNYWLAETGKGSRKSNWNRAWANRIVAVNGRVMREAKFSGAAGNGIGKAAARPMNAAELRSAIAYAEDQNDFERAELLKAELRQRQQTGPPQQIAAALPEQLRQAAQSLRA